MKSPTQISNVSGPVQVSLFVLHCYVDFYASYE